MLNWDDILNNNTLPVCLLHLENAILNTFSVNGADTMWILWVMGKHCMRLLVSIWVDADFPLFYCVVSGWMESATRQERGHSVVNFKLCQMTGKLRRPP